MVYVYNDEACADFEKIIMSIAGKNPNEADWIISLLEKFVNSPEKNSTFIRGTERISVYCTPKIDSFSNDMRPVLIVTVEDGEIISIRIIQADALISRWASLIKAIEHDLGL